MTGQPDNLGILKHLAEEHSLDYEEIAAFTEYSLDSVRSWYCKPDSDRYRPVPDRALSLLRANLKEKKSVRI